jgi:hypothetical protein
MDGRHSQISWSEVDMGQDRHTSKRPHIIGSIFQQESAAHATSETWLHVTG